MTGPVWRNVFTTPGFDAKLDYYFGTDPEGSEFTASLLDDEVIPYIKRAFEEDWSELPLVDPGPDAETRFRYYDYRGDAVPQMYIFGRLDRVALGGSLTEEDIVLYDLIVPRIEQPLDDPGGRTPDR